MTTAAIEVAYIGNPVHRVRITKTATKLAVAVNRATIIRCRIKGTRSAAAIGRTIKRYITKYAIYVARHRVTRITAKTVIRTAANVTRMRVRARIRCRVTRAARARTRSTPARRRVQAANKVAVAIRVRAIAACKRGISIIVCKTAETNIRSIIHVIQRAANRKR